MDEENKDLKAEDQTSDETDQLNEENKGRSEFNNEEEKISLPKSEYDKLVSDRDNYKQGMLNAKNANRTIPGLGKKEDKAPKYDDAEEYDEFDEKFVKKADFERVIQKSAIAEASKDPEVNEYWDEIMEYYVPRNGKDTVEDILRDVKRAHNAWRQDNPNKVKQEKKDDTDKKVKSTLSTDNAVNKGKEKAAPAKKKSILLNKEEKIGDWYGSNK